MQCQTGCREVEPDWPPQGLFPDPENPENQMEERTQCRYRAPDVLMVTRLVCLPLLRVLWPCGGGVAKFLLPVQMACLSRPFIGLA
jgi:hypothetical protein